MDGVQGLPRAAKSKHINPSQAHQSQSKWIKPVLGETDSRLTRPFFAPFLSAPALGQRMPLVALRLILRPEIKLRRTQSQPVAVTEKAPAVAGAVGCPRTAKTGFGAVFALFQTEPSANKI